MDPRRLCGRLDGLDEAPEVAPEPLVESVGVSSDSTSISGGVSRVRVALLPFVTTLSRSQIRLMVIEYHRLHPLRGLTSLKVRYSAMSAYEYDWSRFSLMILMISCSSGISHRSEPFPSLRRQPYGGLE